MLEKHVMLDVNSVLFDRENPRIKGALEKYGDKVNAERISFALQSATEGSQRTSSFEKLKDSIRARGIIHPIVVVQRNGEFICIDGNTRLAIYRDFLEQGVKGDWQKIKSNLLGDATELDIESVRITAHLVGARQWPAYEKARYLHHLRNVKFLDYNEMIEICGGNKREIEMQIDAFHDMNEYYRDLVDDASFRVNRFSGFVELQKPSVKPAIYDAGYGLKDFGEWIRDGKIYNLNDVRNLPKVLRDDEAREIFIGGSVNSISDALQTITSRSWSPKKVNLENATVYQLAETLRNRINHLPFHEFSSLRNRSGDAEDKLAILEDLVNELNELISSVSE